MAFRTAWTRQERWTGFRFGIAFALGFAAKLQHVKLECFMGNRRKAVASSEETSPQSTDVALLKTSCSTRIASASDEDAVCPCSTETGGGSWSKGHEIDWRVAFQTLSKLLGREMISSDVFYFVGSGLAEECGVEVAKELLVHARKHRGSNIDDFMG
jgi:hypothetical protein